MKIAMLVPVFPKLSETFIAAKFIGLLERGHNVRIICQKFDRDAVGYFPGLSGFHDLEQRVVVRRPTDQRWRAARAAPGAAVKAFAAGPRRSFRYFARGWRKFGIGLFRQFYLDAELIECGADVVHFEFGTLARGRVEPVGWFGGKAVVSFRGHDLLFVGLDDQDYYADVWEHADGFHLLGNALWREARRRGCPAEKLHRVIPPAINTGFFQPARRERFGILGMSQRPIRLVSVGRLDWTKGYEYLLQAIARLRNLGVKVEYRVVGGGDYAEALAFARREMGLVDIVAFLGVSSPEMVRDALQWADIFLHGAVAEGFSNAVLEAQAMELPVVTSDAHGLPENVLDGETGFVVPRRDAVALADRVLELAVQPALRNQMGRAGRRRVLAEFNIERQLDAFERLYECVLAAEAVRPPDRLEAALPIGQHPAA